jgi:hypothetical protein
VALLAVRAGRGIMPSWRSDEPVSVEAEVTSTFCYGNAGPHDYHLAADIVAVDERRSRSKNAKPLKLKRRDNA